MALVALEAIQECPVASGRLNAGFWIAWSSTREELTSGVDFHSSHHWEMMFVGSVSVQRGLRDGRQFCEGKNT